MDTPSNFSPSTNESKSTLFLEDVDVGLHSQNGGVPVVDLDWIVEDPVFNHFSFLVFLDILGIDFGLAFYEEFLVALLDYGRTFFNLLWLHL